MASDSTQLHATFAGKHGHPDSSGRKTMFVEILKMSDFGHVVMLSDAVGSFMSVYNVDSQG